MVFMLKNLWLKPSTQQLFCLILKTIKASFFRHPPPSLSIFPPCCGRSGRRFGLAGFYSQQLHTGLRQACCSHSWTKVTCFFPMIVCASFREPTQILNMYSCFRSRAHHPHFTRASRFMVKCGPQQWWPPISGIAFYWCFFCLVTWEGGRQAGMMLRMSHNQDGFSAKGL